MLNYSNLISKMLFSLPCHCLCNSHTSTYLDRFIIYHNISKKYFILQEVTTEVGQLSFYPQHKNKRYIIQNNESWYTLLQLNAVNPNKNIIAKNAPFVFVQERITTLFQVTTLSPQQTCNKTRTKQNRYNTHTHTHTHTQ